MAVASSRASGAWTLAAGDLQGSESSTPQRRHVHPLEGRDSSYRGYNGETPANGLVHTVPALSSFRPLVDTSFVEGLFAQAWKSLQHLSMEALMTRIP